VDCRHHPRCPGCPLLPRPYADQLVAKRQRLADALGLFGHLQLPAVPDVRPALHTEAYRHRLKLPLHHGPKHVSIGLVDPRSGKVLHTPDCPVLAEGLRCAMPPLLAWLKGRRSVHSVDLRVSAATGELQLVLACRAGKLPGGKGGARQLLRDVPGLVSVAVSEADPTGRRVMGRRPRMVAGQPLLPERIGATDYVLYPGAFFQADPRNAVQIHELVKRLVGEVSTVADLYAGVGAYGRMLAPHVQRVVAIEEVPQAAKAAAHQAPSHLSVTAGRVEDLPLSERFDAVVLNPARRGCDPGALAHLATRTDRMVMVSCGPETLARDLDVLGAHGLRVTQLHAVDLFPQTAEVEAVVLLERGPAVRSWSVPGGRARSPWQGGPSGAKGRPSVVEALVLGDARRVRLRGARVAVERQVAGHSLVELTLKAPLRQVLQQLTRAGHPVAGEDAKTRRFFQQKGYLQRPYVHVLRAGNVTAPRHGDLQICLDRLR
jgi:tRNA/tmRNA/rRNA uracil-C5-methylase (TrmA/RlmC/RlmD family)